MKIRGQGKVFKKNHHWWIDIQFKGNRCRESVIAEGVDKTMDKLAKKQAEAVLSKRVLEISENRFLDIKKDYAIRFKDLCAKYVEWIKDHRKHSEAVGYYIANLQKHFGNPLISEISREDVSKYITRRKKEAKDKTIIHEVSVLRQMYFLATEEWDNPKDKRKKFYEGINPAARFNKNKTLKGNKRDRYATKQELIRLINTIISEQEKVTTTSSREALTRLMDFILFAVNTGLRKGEMQKLYSGSKDIHIDELEPEKSFLMARETKNGTDRRVPLNKIALAVVKREFLFKYNPRKQFEEILEKAEIEGLTFHDLRRTFATHLQNLGVHQFTIASLLGHTVPGFEMTRIYAQTTEEQMIEAVGKLEKYLMDLIPSQFSGSLVARFGNNDKSELTQLISS